MIHNDAEYEKMLKRLVKGAEYLDDPLLSEEDYEKGMTLYNELERKILKYQGMEWAISE